MRPDRSQQIVYKLSAAEMYLLDLIQGINRYQLPPSSNDIGGFPSLESPGIVERSNSANAATFDFHLQYMSTTQKQWSFAVDWVQLIFQS